MKSLALLMASISVLVAPLCAASRHDHAGNGLADTTVMIIRHAEKPQGQRHIFKRCQVWDQSEFLKDNADLPAHLGKLVPVERGDIAVRQENSPGRRLLRRVNQAQKG